MPAEGKRNETAEVNQPECCYDFSKKKTNPIERLVVYAGREKLDDAASAMLEQLRLLSSKHGDRIPPMFTKVHLMHEHEDLRLRAVLPTRIQTIDIIPQIPFRVLRLDVEDVDEHADVAEDGGALSGEVGIHECLLAAAVPEIEHDGAEETDVVHLDVDCCTEASRPGGGVVGTG